MDSLKRLVLIIPLIIFGFLLFSWIVMLLWNNVASPLLHISTISFKQAIGILILCKILFSGFGGRNSFRHFRKEKIMWEIMTPEQKDRFREEWKSRTWFYCSKSLESET